MGKIAKNYIYNLLFQVLILVLPLILSPFLVRVLGSEQLGIFSFVTSSANIIVTIGLLGTYNYGCRQIAYKRDDINECNDTYNQIFSVRLFLGVILTVAYFLLCFFEREYTEYFLVYYSWVLSMIIDPSWYFVGQEDMKTTALKNTAVRLSALLLIFAFVKPDGGLMTYIGIMGFSALICNLALFFQLKKYHIHHSFQYKKIEEHIKGSLALFWPQVATLFYLQIDKIMLKYLTDDISQVSYYDYGEKIVTIPLMIITTLNTVMMPRVANEYANKNTANMRALLVKAGEFSLMLAMPMMVGMVVCANKLIPWYLGYSYYPSILVIILVSPIIVTNSLSGISGNQYFVATDQTNILLRAYIFSAVLNMGINALLIPRYGCNGAAVATIVAATASVLIQYYYMNKQINVKVFLKFCIKYFVYSIPVGISAYVVGYQMNATPLTSVVQVVVGVSLYFVILLITHDSNLFMIVEKLKMIIRNKRC